MAHYLAAISPQNVCRFHFSVCVCVCVYVHARACVCDHMGRCHLLLRLLTEGVFVHLSLEDYTGQRGGEGGEGERREEKCELKMLEGRY